MSEAWPMIQMKDEFYQQYQLPNLPLPISSESLTRSLNSDGISFAVISDNLHDYLVDNPGDIARYKPIIVRMAYQAGVVEGEQGKHEDAGYYFTIAKMYDPQDVNVIAGLALSFWLDGKNDRAIQEYEIATAMIRDYGFSPQIWLALANLYFKVGDLENGERVVRDYFEQAHTTTPHQFYESVEYGYNSCLESKADDRMTQMFLDRLSSE